MFSCNFVETKCFPWSANHRFVNPSLTNFPQEEEKERKAEEARKKKEQEVRYKQGAGLLSGLNHSIFKGVKC